MIKWTLGKRWMLVSEEMCDLCIHLWFCSSKEIKTMLKDFFTKVFFFLCPSPGHSSLDITLHPLAEKQRHRKSPKVNSSIHTDLFCTLQKKKIPEI